MTISEPRRRTLAIWSFGLVLVSLTGSIAASFFLDGYVIDWASMGLMAATLMAMAALLAKPERPRLHRALNALAIALTIPFAAWVLLRMLS